jgi:hypothetical protein
MSLLGAAGASTGAAPEAADMDRAVLTDLQSRYGIRASVVQHLDLTTSFGTRTPWALVITKQPDAEGFRLGIDPEGAVSVCFVRGSEPDCSEALIRAHYRQHKFTLVEGEQPFYELIEGRVVHAGPGDTGNLLELKACTIHGVNGSCGISTLLLAYDRRRDAFDTVFANLTGKNNNEATRFIEQGPLRGAVVVATPTLHAPFAYQLEVYRRQAGWMYARVLRYRGRTRYADGNPLPVIDSEMPALLARFGAWKSGDALPVPPAMPEDCGRLFLRGGVEWCGPAAP